MRTRPAGTAHGRARGHGTSLTTRIRHAGHAGEPNSDVADYIYRTGRKGQSSA